MNSILKTYARRISALLLVGTGILLAAPVLAASPNLITNPSVESVSGATPTGWYNGSWGDGQLRVEHSGEGHTGSRSLYVEAITASSGDTKWMHQPVSVASGSTYTYSNWYKSNTDTEIDLQFTSTDGSVSYAYVAWVPASTTWKQVTTEFTVPAGATSASVMHLVAGIGWLQIDDMSLTQKTGSVPPVTEPGPQVPSNNILANGSLAQSTGTAPTAWSTNTWGDISANFTYNQTGRTDTRSVTTTVSRYVSGDAKWYATPVDIAAGKEYAYSDYYTANVPTRVVAVWIDANGNYTYQELPSAPAASAWTRYTVNITAPSTAKRGAVYHIIDRVGSMTLDDASLELRTVTTPTPTPEPTAPSPIANASLETASGNTPLGWSPESWGANATTFEYPTAGRTGSRSVKLTVANYLSGDAKWMATPVNSLKEDTDYRFSAWYKTSAEPRVIAMYTMTDNSVLYSDLPRAIGDPAMKQTSWQHYSQAFTTPVGVKSTSIFMLLDQNGWLQTDDYEITPYAPTGFSRALLTLTFDDGHEDNVTTALPLMNQAGIKSTQCYATEYIEGKPQYIKDDVMKFINSGHEICSHSVSHPMLSRVSPEQLRYELEHSKTYLQQLTGRTVKNFASPYGDYSATMLAEVKKVYQSHRSVDAGFNSRDNFDIYNIRVQNVLDTTSAEQVSEWIQRAQAEKTWLVLVYHRVASDPGLYDTSTESFTQHVNVIKQSGIPTATYQQGLDEVRSQL